MNCPELELGHMCHDGLDVERDYAKAMEWYLKATRSSGNFLVTPREFEVRV